MEFKANIKSLLTEAELYRKQGLISEARANYVQALEMIRAKPNIRNRDQLMAGIAQKIGSLDEQLKKFESAEVTPEIEAKIQDLIKSQFAFADDEESRALEGAIALAKFGQFERALSEFEGLLEHDKMRVDAAKNILRCHVALNQPQEALAVYRQWMGSDRFKDNETRRIQVFFKTIATKEGLDLSPSEAAAESPAAPAQPEAAEAAPPADGQPEVPLWGLDEGPPMGDMDEDDDEILEINSIGLAMDAGQEEEMVELNVSFQSANVISLLIPSGDAAILQHLEPGTILDEVSFYSPIAIFSGRAEVMARTQIESGPRRGDFTVDMKVLGN
jgi:tetratricopeptide (TPR) repeat protein